MALKQEALVAPVEYLDQTGKLVGMNGSRCVELLHKGVSGDTLVKREVVDLTGEKVINLTLAKIVP